MQLRRAAGARSRRGPDANRTSALLGGAARRAAGAPVGDRIRARAGCSPRYGSLLTSVAALAAILVGAAALAAFSVARNVHNDVDLRARPDRRDGARGRRLGRHRDPGAVGRSGRGLDQRVQRAGRSLRRRRTRVSPGPGRRAGLRPRPQRVSGRAQPRASHAAQRDPRFHRGAAGRGRRTAQRRSAREPDGGAHQRRTPAQPDRRHPRSVRARVRRAPAQPPPRRRVRRSRSRSCARRG